MSIALADLRKNPPKARTTTNYRVSLRGDLVAQVQALVEDLAQLEQAKSETDPDKPAPPRRMSERAPGPDPRSAEITDKLAALQPTIEAHTGDLTLRAIRDDTWRAWVDDHPPRPAGTPTGARDKTITEGICNADALLASMAEWVYAWEGEPLATDDWESTFVESIHGGDLRQIAHTIVMLQEGRAVDLPKLLSVLLADLGSERASS